MLRPDNPKMPTAQDSGTEMANLTATVAKWGMETGFLGLEHSVEPMLTSLVREAAGRLFGSFEGDLSRFREERDTLEEEWELAAHRIAEYRSRFGDLIAKHGLLSGFRAWMWTFVRSARRGRCAIGENRN